MIVFGGGRGPRLAGCLPLLLAGAAISLLIYAVSGGQCVAFVFP